VAVLNSNIQVWLSPEEVKLEGLDNLYRPDVFMKNLDLTPFSLEGLTRKHDIWIKHKRLPYRILYLKNCKYEFVYVLEGFEDWFLKLFELGENNYA